MSFLKPTMLFGLSEFGSIPHAVFWSMLFNISAFIVVSIVTKSSSQEEQIANEFVNILKRKEDLSYNGDLTANIDSYEKIQIFEQILNQYLNKAKTKKNINKIKKQFKLKEHSKINILELSKIHAYLERILAGTLGTAGANNALKKSNIFTQSQSNELSDIYTKVLKKMKISPDEFSKKINYFEEKQKLLNEHYEQLKFRIRERDQEIIARKNAEEEILNLNETLEEKVNRRTNQLKVANDELEKSMNELKFTQDNLIEAEKMASLGELVAGVAHEINTPVGSSLTGITHFISISNDVQKLYKSDDLSQEEFEVFFNKIKRFGKKY